MTKINYEEILAKHCISDDIIYIHSNILNAMKDVAVLTKQACIEQIKKDSPEKTYSCMSIQNNVIIE